MKALMLASLPVVLALRLMDRPVELTHPDMTPGSARGITDSMSFVD